MAEEVIDDNDAFFNALTKKPTVKRRPVGTGRTGNRQATPAGMPEAEEVVDSPVDMDRLLVENIAGDYLGENKQSEIAANDYRNQRAEEEFFGAQSMAYNEPMPADLVDIQPGSAGRVKELNEEKIRNMASQNIFPDVFKEWTGTNERTFYSMNDSFEKERFLRRLKDQMDREYNVDKRRSEIYDQIISPTARTLYGTATTAAPLAFKYTRFFSLPGLVSLAAEKFAAPYIKEKYGDFKNFMEKVERLDKTEAELKELQEDFEQLKSIMEDSGSSEPRSVESLEDQYDKGSVSL